MLPYPDAASPPSLTVSAATVYRLPGGGGEALVAAWLPKHLCLITMLVCCELLNSHTQAGILNKELGLPPHRYAESGLAET